MRRAAPILSILGLCAIFAPARAVDILGPGGAKCEQWTRASGDDEHTILIWVLGYLSGANVFGTHSRDLLQGVDADDVEEALDDYCKDHPTDSIADAAEAYIDQRDK